MKVSIKDFNTDEELGWIEFNEELSASDDDLLAMAEAWSKVVGGEDKVVDALIDHSNGYWYGEAAA